jgi:hypothetical protein
LHREGIRVVNRKGEDEVMKRIARVLPSVALVVLTTSSAWADPVTVTFDQPPCAPVAPGIYPGDCYVSLGMRFGSGMGTGAFPFDSNGLFMIAADPNAVSPPNVARPVPGFALLGATFSPVNVLSGTSSVSLNVVGSVPGQMPWRVEFVGTDGDLSHFSGTTDQLISYCLECNAGGIFGFRFFPGTASQGIDNLTRNPAQASAVPEPATVLLTGGGIVALARRRWRGRQHRPEALVSSRA